MASIDVLYADRSERGKLRLTGPQHLWFLHQILTQSFEDMQVGEARAAAMITAHGRLTGYLETLAVEEAVFCHFDSDLRTTLPDEIARYVFATQVAIEDVGDEMGLVLIAGDDWKSAAEGHTIDVMVHPTHSLGVPAAYLWVGHSDLQGLLLALERRGARPVSEDELEAVRIANGVPRWGFEMDTKTFPQEVGIDDWAVHYDKGCYLGQEAMAKIHFRGKVNRRLVRVELGGPVNAGSDLTVDGRRVGRITSVAGTNALALVPHDLDQGVAATVDGVEAKVID